MQLYCREAKGKESVKLLAQWLVSFAVGVHNLVGANMLDFFTTVKFWIANLLRLEGSGTK